ncbi:MAG: flagellar hook-basal body complex protein FliE [Lachnospiraceae bacterium]|nr:flagellar hook-basal body complex protein FliE [Lachnospiraceae bacterium]
MDITALTNVSSNYIKQFAENNPLTQVEENDDFASVLQTSINLINNTNDYQNAAEQAEIQFALGESTNTHDLAIAQQKANITLQYTVAVRDRVIEAYNSIMNMNI